MECLFGGAWDVQSTPSCVRRHCGLPPSISNGFVESGTGAVYQSQVTYRCRNGYSITGGNPVTCGDDGSWGAAPFCSVVTCPVLNFDLLLVTASLESGDGTEAGTVYSLTCPPGYQLSGDPRLLCGGSGSWSNAIPTCQKLLCKVPSVGQASVTVGGVAAGPVVSYLDVVSVVCDVGYVVAGTSSRVTTRSCGADQTFGDLPTCEVSNTNYCLNNPCSVNEDCTSIIGTFQCSCKQGYNRTNGIDCSDIDECALGTSGCLEQCNNIGGGYQCNCDVGKSLYTQAGYLGYRLPSVETGALQGDIYYIDHTCVLNRCLDPGSVANGYMITPQTNYYNGDSIKIGCNLGYVPVNGVTTASCSVFGTWSPGIPACQVAQCPPDAPADISSQSYPPLVSPRNQNIDYGSTVNIFCNVPGVGFLTKQRTCVYDPTTHEYRLQGDSYTCEELDCGEPEVHMKAGARALFLGGGRSTTYDSQFVFECELPTFRRGSSSQGDTTVRCGTSGTWDFGDLECVTGYCPDPGSPPDAVSSVSGYSVQSVVSYQCARPGYAVLGDIVRGCEANITGQLLVWNGTLPTCQDLSPPVFTNCESEVLPPQSLYSPATITPPTATDNSGSYASLVVSPASFLSGQSLSAGLTVTYTVTDHAGLSDTCTKTFSVSDETLPTIKCPAPILRYLGPGQTVNYDFQTSDVEVSDNVGVASTTFSPTGVFFTYSDVGTVVDVTAVVEDAAGNRASCQLQAQALVQKCGSDTLSAPPGTVKSCVETQTGGYNCTFTCQPNYFFYEAYPNEEFVTSCEPGQDFDQDYIPACSESIPIRTVARSTILYNGPVAYENNDTCVGQFEAEAARMLTELRANMTLICAAQGTIQAVQLKEGSMDVSTVSILSRTAISFSLEILPPGVDDAEYTTCVASIIEQLKLLEDPVNKDTSVFSNLLTLTAGGCATQTKFISFTQESLECESDLITRSVNNTDVCYKCPPGTNYGSGVCSKCPVGSYWVTSVFDYLGQCALCPAGQSTASEGLIGSQACQLRCVDNSVSSTGVTPCSECTDNTYRYNTTHCAPCPDGTLALRAESPLYANCTDACTYTAVANTLMLSAQQSVQSQSVLECQNVCEAWETIVPGSTCVGFSYNRPDTLCIIHDTVGLTSFNVNFDYYERKCTSDDQEACYCSPKCPGGQYSETGHQPNCRSCPDHYISGTGQTFCFECQSDQVTQGGVNICVDGAPLLCPANNNPCLNGGVCSVDNHNVACQCPAGFRGSRCEEVINACASSPCFYGSQCTPEAGGAYSCSCVAGTAGSRCETNLPDCQPDTCSGRGTCLDGLDTFTCLCVDGFNGSRCEGRTQLACDLLACDPAGTAACVAVSEIYATCSCKAGYSGPTCSEDVDACLSEPCQNGGTCVDTSDPTQPFVCNCASGFVGSTCASPVSTCASATPCVNEDSCHDDYNTGLPLCHCAPGYAQDKLCEFEPRYGFRIDGDLITSKNVSKKFCQAQCVFSQSLYSADCVGFSFQYTDDALLGVCQLYSSIDSVAPQTGGFEVQALVKTCSYVTDDTFYSPYIKPRRFETDIDSSLADLIRELDEVVCQATVQDTVPLDAQCIMITGDPVPAEIKCDKSGVRCVNSANVTCADLEIRFLCARSRTSGTEPCRVRDVCGDTSPCLQGGLCFNNVNESLGYTCTCPPGYEGARCQREIDECALYSGTPQGCQNGATCVDEFVGVSCVCAAGFEGPLCETNTNDCPGSCNTSTSQCVDQVDSVSCVCLPGYTGPDCSVDIDDCVTQPCLHGGVCSDRVNGYTCSCAAGWEGLTCEPLLWCCPLRGRLQRCLLQVWLPIRHLRHSL